MRFGKCAKCKEYKYLDNGTKCPSCINNSGWFVYRVVGLAMPKLIDEGLTKEEAEAKASCDKFLMATDKKLGC